MNKLILFEFLIGKNNNRFIILLFKEIIYLLSIIITIDKSKFYSFRIIESSNRNKEIYSLEMII